MHIKVGSFELSVGRKKSYGGLYSVPGGRGGWYGIVREPATGDWQRNREGRALDPICHPTYFAGVTLLASDISKAGFGLWKPDEKQQISVPASSPSFSPVLRKPNHYQNRMQFIEQWVLSKVTRGNTYILKGRDDRGVVDREYPLDPTRVVPMVASSGDVFYALGASDLAAPGGLDESIIVPARDIIHDRWNCLFHSLVGVSPVYAAAAAALRSLRVLDKASQFLDNGSAIGGLLLAPGDISEQTAKKLEDFWDANYIGAENAGRIAALGDGMKFEKLDMMTAVDAQVIEQLDWDDKKICAALHIPGYMVGVGDMPDDWDKAVVRYYQQGVQVLVEGIELCQEEGLGAADAGYEVEFDQDNFFRMDAAAKMEYYTAGIKGGIFSPNRARRAFNEPPLRGGDTVYMQEQDHSLQWLADRDALGPPPPGKPVQPPLAPAAKQALLRALLEDEAEPPPPPQKSFTADEIVGAALRHMGIGA